MLTHLKLSILLAVRDSFIVASSGMNGGASMGVERPRDPLSITSVRDDEVAAHFTSLYIPEYFESIKNVELVSQMSGILNQYDITLALAMMHLGPSRMVGFVRASGDVVQELLEKHIPITSFEAFKAQAPPDERAGLEKSVTPRRNLRLITSDLDAAWNELSPFLVAWDLIQLISKLVELYHADVSGMNWELRQTMIRGFAGYHYGAGFKDRALTWILDSVIMSISSEESNALQVRKALDLLSRKLGTLGPLRN